jgi:hypothetical protein
MDKISSFSLHISTFVFLLLRQRRGAVTATSAPRSIAFEKTTSGAAGISLGAQGQFGATNG